MMNDVQHLQFPASKVKRENLGKWQWCEWDDGSWWATWWAGGEMVDFYGPFEKINRLVIAQEGA